MSLHDDPERLAIAAGYLSGALPELTGVHPETVLRALTEAMTLRDSLTRHPEAAPVNICDPCACVGPLSPGLHVRPQLQVQAPVGDSPQVRENGASGEEREALDDLIQKHWVATPGEFRNVLLAWMVAAGYRKAPVVNVEDVAQIICEHENRGDSWADFDEHTKDWYRETATAVLDLLKRGA